MNGKLSEGRVQKTSGLTPTTIVFGVLFIVFFSLFLWMTYRFGRDSVRAFRWPSSPANVLQSQVTREADRRFPFAEITYSYGFEGKDYTDRFRSSPLIPPIKGEWLIKDFQPGYNITVKVDPRDPSKSLLPWANSIPDMLVVIVTVIVWGISGITYERLRMRQKRDELMLSL